MDIRVGPEAKPFQVHKNILVSAAAVFQKMFEGQFIEAIDLAANFPEDDEAAWEALIEWMYEVLHSLAPDCSNLDAAGASDYTNRIKLCCLAEKYSILTLYNAAIDSVVGFMEQESAATPLFQWQVFRDCYVYVYSHSSEGSALRHLFSLYFSLLLECPKNVCKSTYKSHQMLSLATEIPDLLSDFFDTTQQKRESDAGRVWQLEPWKIDPCTFHIHSPGGGACPRALGGQSSFKWPSIEARVHYYLQDVGSKGGSFYVPEVRDCIDITPSTSERIIQAMNSLIQDKANVDWENENESFFLITPEEFKRRTEQKQKESGGSEQ